MFSLKKFAAPQLAALFLIALPACPVLAQEAPAKTPAAAVANDKAVVDSPKTPAATETAKPSPSDPMVRVNGTTITRLELDRAVKVMLAQNRVQQPLPPELLKQAQDAALEQLSAAELLYQEASKVEVKDLDKQVTEKIQQNRAKFETEADFEKALKGVDMTLKDMQDFTRKDIIISNFIETQYAAKVKVTDAEAQAFYKENVDKYFSKPETARASHILIGVDEKASADDKKKAKEKAEALLKRVKGGEDFAAVAKAESTCPSSSQGGDLGTFTSDQMVPAFSQAAFAMKPGQVSDVVETQFGYHIIKLTEKQEASKDSFDSVKEKIVDFLKREQTQKEVVALVAKLKETAKIEKL